MMVVPPESAHAKPCWLIIHHHRVARCPGTGGVLHVGVHQWMLAAVTVISNRAELNGGWRRYLIDIDRAPTEGFVWLLDICNQPDFRVRFTVATAVSANWVIRA
jgi:hypothetical protein